MSNTQETETESVPLINPDALPQLIEMIEDSVRRHTEAIETAEKLIERLDETEDHGIAWEECDLIIKALGLLIEAREEDIEVQEQGLVQMKEAAAKIEAAKIK
ncbi:MAG: hypothetical protein ACYSSM_04815 [Planctomycetota bacterium]|jgi:3-hydroxyacyl-CoA dehydrogenase